jgi:hypothetical protein
MVIYVGSYPTKPGSIPGSATIVGISLETPDFCIAGCLGENTAQHAPWSPRSTG